MTPRFLWIQCKLLTNGHWAFLLADPIFPLESLVSFILPSRGLCVPPQPRVSACLCQAFTSISPMLANIAIEFIKSSAQVDLPL